MYCTRESYDNDFEIAFLSLRIKPIYLGLTCFRAAKFWALQCRTRNDALVDSLRICSQTACKSS